ncbi:MAG: putative rane-bound acyltransferase [Frankiales bacterium]|nr:putative rane-bound acyltransferase [Frankiales bacterium]
MTSTTTPSVRGSVGFRDAGHTTAFLDGLRGLAAVAVALCHAFLFTGLTGETTARFPVASHVFLLGQLAVAAFIVLSGFVLALPAVDNDGRLRGGPRAFMRRRARRILPPYYAAFGASVLLVALVPSMSHDMGTAWDSKVPVSAGGIAAHLALVHDLSSQWIFQANGPLWSIAVEFQLYFFLPLVLLPLRRRLGVMTTTVLAIAVSAGAGLLVPSTRLFHGWLLGCFALGMLAADLAVGSGNERWRTGAAAVLRPHVLGPVSVIALVVLMIVGTSPDALLIAPDLLVASLLAAWIVVLMRGGTGGVRRVRELLSGKVLAGLGLFSYSVYLVHAPILALVNVQTLSWHLPLGVRLAMLVGAAVPLAICVAYAFHRLVERRFMTAHQVHAVTTPAATQPRQEVE